MRFPFIVLTVSLSTAVFAPVASSESQKVDAFNFARAESDLYFSRVVKKNGGLNRLVHGREPTPIDQQVVVRMNRDTLYSSSVHDLSAGPVTVTMPEDNGGRFQSLQVVSEDHYTPFVIYGGTVKITQQNVGTRYVLLIMRTFVDPKDPRDIDAAHAAQDAISVDQAVQGIFDIPEWDDESQKKVRDALGVVSPSKLRFTAMFG